MGIVLGYSLKQFGRNKKRVLALMVGVVISLTLVAGINMASDSVRAFKMMQALDAVDADYQVTLDTSDWEAVEATLRDTLPREEPLVREVFTTYSVTASKVNVSRGTTGVDWAWLNATHFNRTHFATTSISGVNLSLFFQLARFADYLRFAAPLSTPHLAPGEVYVSNEFAENAGLAIGDTFTVGALDQEYNHTLRAHVNTTYDYAGTLRVKNIFAFNDPENMPGESAYQDSHQYRWFRQLFPYGYSTVQLLCGLDLAETVATALHTGLRFRISHHYSQSTGSYIEYREMSSHAVIVLVSHDLDVSDATMLQQRFRQLRFQIYSTAGYENVDYVYDFLSNQLSTLEVEISMFRTITLVVAIPVLLLSVFLINTLYAAVLEARRVEIGQLKSRGAKESQITRILLLETVFLGAFAGGVALLGGYLTSYALLGQIFGETFPEFLATAGVQVTTFTIVLSLAMGVGLSLFGAYKPIKRFSKLPITEVMAKYHEEEATHVEKKRRDWLVLVMGVLPLTTLFVDYGDFYSTGLPSPLMMVLTILWPILVPLTILSPFILTYALTKFLVGRSPARFSRVTSKLCRAFSGDVGFIASRNLARNPVRATRLAFIIAMTLSFGIASSVVHASQEEFQVDMANREYGADLKIWSSVAPLNQSFSANLTGTFPDMTRTCEAVQFYASVEGGTDAGPYTPYGSSSINVVTTNVTDYLATAYLKPRYLGGDPATVLRRLQDTPNSTIVEESWAEDYGFTAGDRVSLEISLVTTPGGNAETETSVELTIVGVVQFVPGFSRTWRSVFLTDFSTFNETLFAKQQGSDLNHYYLADVSDAPSMNSTTLARGILETFPDAVRDVDDRNAALTPGAGAEGDQLFLTALDLLEFEYYFLLGVATTGIVILFFLSIMEKRREMGLYRARGMSPEMLVRVHFTEGAVIILIGTLVGLVGFLVGWLLNRFLDTTFMVASYHRPYVVPVANVLVLLGVSIGAFLLIIYAAVKLEVRRSDVGRLPDILRIV